MLGRRECGDFLLVHTALYASRAGDRKSAWAVARRAATIGRPGVAAWLVWALQLISPRWVDCASSLAVRVKRNLTATLARAA
jgi:hypothetical protein